jgi:antitoxin (DNA-binding transcriptional repressor) of toxin-antitoxin stability system
MRTMKAGNFKAHCLALLDEVSEGGEPILVTKRGRPVAVVSAPALSAGNPRERLFGSVVFEGDLVSPIGEAWEAEHARP